MLELIQPGLFPVWNSATHRFNIFWKDPDTGMTRYIHEVEDENGNYADVDERAILYLSNNVAWDCLKKYPHPNETYKYMKSRKLMRKQRMRDYMESERQYSKTHFRREWKAALRNAQAGILGHRPKPVEKKMVSYPGWAKKYKDSPGQIVITK